jgi:hypothetical protein
MNYAKLVGLRKIPCDHQFEDDKDYRITLLASPDGEYKDKKDPKNPILTTSLRFTQIENIEDFISKESIKFEKGYTPSQRQRFAINDSLLQFTNNVDEDYEKAVNKTIKMFNLMSELKINPLEKLDKINQWLENERQ